MDFTFGTASSMPAFKRLAPPYSGIVLRLKRLTGQPLFVARHVVPAQSLNIVPFDESTLILEVKQRPKLEARIRNRDPYAIVPCLLFGLRQVRMIVNIENTPGNIELQVRVFSTLGGLFRRSLEVNGALDKSLGGPSRLDLQLD